MKTLLYPLILLLGIPLAIGRFFWASEPTPVPTPTSQTMRSPRKRRKSPGTVDPAPQVPVSKGKKVKNKTKKYLTPR